MVKIEQVLLRLLLVLLGIGLFGYLFFTLNPENLVRFSSLAGLHRPAMIGLALAQTTIFVILVAWRSVLVLGALRTVAAFAAVAGLGFAVEYLGTSRGWIFGAYEYTELMGPQMFGHVPYIIPPSWFAASIPLFVWVSHLFPGNVVLRVGVGAALLTTWDLALDPAMSHLLPYWVWSTEAFYFQSPFVNFVGWFLTGLGIMLLCEILVSAQRARRFQQRWAVVLYALSFVMPLGMCILAGEWWAVVVTALGLLVCLIPAIFARLRKPGSSLFGTSAVV